jgi:hypothetical protein
MRTNLRISASLLTIVWGALSAAAQTPAPMTPVTPQTPAPAAQALPPAESQPVIEPRADEQLRKMAEFLRSKQAFRFRAFHDFDVIEEEGQRLRMHREVHLQVARPDRIHGSARGYGGRSEYWYDGKQVALLDAEDKTYSRVKAPPTIDDMLEEMSERYGLAVPTGDLLGAKVYETLVESVLNGRYIGRVELEGRACHHLAFQQLSVDWQIWIADGPEPVPLQLVLDYHDQPGAPQFQARFRDWDFNHKPDAKAFEFSPPPDCRETPLEPLADDDDGSSPAQSNFVPQQGSNP